MLTLSSLEINAWIAGLLWPLTRILGMVAAAPLFGHASVPTQVKVILGVLLALIIAPTVPNIPATDPMSYAGLLILVQELLVGLAMGFAMRLVFAAIEYAGELASSTMGFSFASFFDPTTQGRSAAISQFLSMVATMAFLAVNAHLVLLAALAESFVSLPISGTPLSSAAPLELAVNVGAFATVENRGHEANRVPILVDDADHVEDAHVAERRADSIAGVVVVEGRRRGDKNASRGANKKGSGNKNGGCRPGGTTAGDHATSLPSQPRQS